jgi:hypothetical protein
LFGAERGSKEWKRKRKRKREREPLKKSRAEVNELLLWAVGSSDILRSCLATDLQENWYRSAASEFIGGQEDLIIKLVR